MLLKPTMMMEVPPTEPLYNPTIHLTQNELMEKFNLAFYEGQNLSKHDILQTFKEPEIKDDYLIDYLTSISEPSPINHPPSCGDEEENNFLFDFGDFVQTFSNHQQSSLSSTITETTISTDHHHDEDDNNYLWEDIDLNDIDILSHDSLDLDDLSTTDLQDLDAPLPPISTLPRHNIDFNTFLRSMPEDHLMPATYQDLTTKSEFGHLIGTRNTSTHHLPEDRPPSPPPNHIILTQEQALKNLHDDPLLSSTIIYPTHPDTHQTLLISESSEDNCSQGDDDINSSPSQPLQCQWDNCYQYYDSQTNLVKHIEKTHVEVKRGDEFTCFWANCPRKIKPFNARYKLLIHMRVHSGEKPNKCPFDGCNKAFSRLENLKIHQRSHTGERPYLCQFPTCSKSFSNSSDRAKHQRTHFDTKPYACQVVGCAKKYTDPSSLRKHVKNHTNEEQLLLKKKPMDESMPFNTAYVKKFFDPNRQKAVVNKQQFNFEHNYSNNLNHIMGERKYDSNNIRQDLKNKISEKSRLMMRKNVL